MFSVNLSVPQPATPVCAGLSRPRTFHEQYIASRPLAYSFIQSKQQPSSSGGVLQCGQAVWLEEIVQRTRLSATVLAFVESIGFVSLDPRLIKRGDGSIPLP